MNEAIRHQNIKNDIIEFILYIFYKIIFDSFSVFMYLVYPEDLAFKTINANNYLISWVVYLFIVICVIKFLKGYFALVYKFLFIIGGMTTIAIYGTQNIPFADFFKAITYWIILFLSCIYFQNKSIKKIKQIKRKGIKNLQIIFLILSIIFTLILSGVYAGFRFTLSFDEVYTYRLNMRASQMPSMVSYLMFFIGGAILPYSFAFFLSRKSYGIATITFLTGILMFSINGMKTWLVIYFLIIGVFLAYKINKQKLISLILIFVSVALIYGVWIYNKNQSASIMGLMSRIIYLPSKIGYNYIVFFDKNEFLYLRESILKYLFSSPYPVSSSFYIIDNNTDILNGARANNGLWGDAYANFAYVGMLIYPILLIFVMNYLMKLMIGEDERLLVSISFILLWSVVNSSFFTWLLTGGVLVIMLVIWLSPLSKNIDKRYVFNYH